MTGLFSRLKKHESSSYIRPNPPVGKKEALFDDNIGFDDVKSLFEMIIWTTLFILCKWIYGISPRIIQWLQG